MNDYYTIDSFKSSKTWKDIIITKDIEDKLIYFLSNLTKKQIRNNPDIIRGFIIYKVDGDWISRFNTIKEKYRHDGFSLNSCITRYGTTEGTKIFYSRSESVKITKEKYLQSHTELDWDILCKKKNSTSLDAFIRRYGKRNGIKRRQDYTKKRRETYKKHGPYPPSINREKFIERYGEIDGMKRYIDWIDKRRRTLSLNGFIEKFGVEGKSKYEEFCKRMDTRSLEARVKRYGAIEGLTIYNESNKRSSYTSSREYYIEKYGLVDGLQRWTEHCHKIVRARRGNTKISRKSQICFWKLYSKLPETLKSICWFGELNEEHIFYVFSHPGITSIIVDFKCGNKIIEFNGTYWHKNKSILDMEKKTYLNNCGYDVHIITEADWDTNNDNVIAAVMKFLTTNNTEVV